VDGFGEYFGPDHAQLVKGYTPFEIQSSFCDHLYQVLLKGIYSISMDGDALKIMRPAGRKNNGK
jgi:hypothetical protein